MKTYIIMFQVTVEDGRIYVTVNKSVSACKEKEMYTTKHNIFPGCVVNMLFCFPEVSEVDKEGQRHVHLGPGEQAHHRAGWRR